MANPFDAWTNAAMPPVKKPTRQRRRHYIKEWREYRNLTQEQVADRIGVSATTFGRIENNQVPYNQDFLEEAANALMCEPWDLLNVNPNIEGKVLDALDAFKRFDPKEQSEALDFLEFQRQRARRS